MRIRSDNGTQPVSNRVYEFLAMITSAMRAIPPIHRSRIGASGLSIPYSAILGKEAIRRFDF